MRVDGEGESPFRRHARQQSGFCAALGAPFTALLCRVLADSIPAASQLGRRLDAWPADPNADALVLRIAGGLHATVLAGDAPALAELYPPAPLPDSDRLAAAVGPVLHDPAFARWLESAPQTNEVGRSGPLAAGMLAVLAATDLPLALFELGASAGLNLLPDRYCLKLGGTTAGSADSPLTIQPQWEGQDPPDVALRIANRAGVDLNPLAVTDPTAAVAMLAYVWPDQPERLARMRHAIALAKIDPPLILAGDAAAFVEANVWPQRGVTTTVFHSIALQYFSKDAQGRIAAHMARAGAAASPAAPLAWLRYEMADPSNPGAPELRLRLWPGDDRLLAVGHPHGSSLKWLA